VAVAAVRLGLSSAFIGKVGEDPFGRRLAGTLGERFLSGAAAKKLDKSKPYDTVK
jgi:sugar/nucleoside kinase (ribokinase family)